MATLGQVDRGWECRVLECAAAAGLAPRAVRCVPTEGILVLEWAAGRPWTPAEIGQPAQIHAMAELLRRVHSLPIPQPAKVRDPKAWIAEYYAALRAGGPGVATPGVATPGVATPGVATPDIATPRTKEPGADALVANALATDERTANVAGAAGPVTDERGAVPSAAAHAGVARAGLDEGGAARSGAAAPWAAAPGAAELSRASLRRASLRRASVRRASLRRASLRRAAQAHLERLAATGSAPAALCHGDLHRFNVVAGARTVLLDWEYAHVTYPFWDLAGWIANNDWGEACATQLLTSYLQRPAGPDEAARLELLVWLYDYVCLLWHELYLKRCCGAPDAALAARRECLAARLGGASGGRAPRVAAH